MMMDNQNLLDLVFELESAKHTLVSFGPGIDLKIVASVSSKDSKGNKKRFFEEFRYESNKYPNTNHLISCIEKFESYLTLEYPIQDGAVKNRVIFLRDYSIDGLLDKMIEFDSKFMDPFVLDKNGQLHLKAGSITKITSYPSANSSISFSQDIYEDINGERDYGVRLEFNEEYALTIRMATTWKKFLFNIRHCDLFTWGHALLQSYLCRLPGMGVSDMNSNKYMSASKYRPYNEDPDDIVNDPESVAVNKNSRFKNNEEKKKEFFNFDNA